MKSTKDYIVGKCLTIRLYPEFCPVQSVKHPYTGLYYILDDSVQFLFICWSGLLGYWGLSILQATKIADSAMCCALACALLQICSSCLKPTKLLWHGLIWLSHAGSLSWWVLQIIQPDCLIWWSLNVVLELHCSSFDNKSSFPGNWSNHKIGTQNPNSTCPPSTCA